jgi:hypothetical protein
MTPQFLAAAAAIFVNLTDPPTPGLKASRSIILQHSSRSGGGFTNSIRPPKH